MTGEPQNTGTQTVIDTLLKRIARSELKDRVTVFGSVARGSADPQDLDIWIHMKDKELGLSIDRDVNFFLALARAFPGYLDPFVQYKNATIVRNAECNEWVGAKFARKIRSEMEKEGIPVSEAITQRGLDKNTADSPKP